MLNTDIYINIDQALFQTENREFHVKVAETLDEACKLSEVGFEYVADMDGKNCSENANSERVWKTIV